ncbi:hypothetical protein AAVH_32139 [Aphelenchoides avenae]|nr:hypothetical protein AAVH_32139 [Aphelenchus avenae]
MSRLFPLLSKLILRRTQERNRHNKGRHRKTPTQLMNDVLLDVLAGVDYNTLLAMSFSCAGFNKFIASRQRSLPNVLEFRLETCFDPFVHSWIDRRTPKDEIRLLRARRLNDPELFDDGSLDVVPLSASNRENPMFNKLTDVLGYTSHETRAVQSRRMTMSRIKQITEGCVITHLCLHMRPDMAVEEIVDSVPLLRHVEFLMLCQASPISRSKSKRCCQDISGIFDG